jgi:hypothetical protein
VSEPEIVETTKACYQVRLTERYWTEADLTTPMSIIVSSERTFQNIEVQSMLHFFVFAINRLGAYVGLLFTFVVLVMMLFDGRTGRRLQKGAS